MTVGTHGSTFGGNPLAMAVGHAVLDVVLAPEFLPRVQRLGLLLRQCLAEISDRHGDLITEIRGQGLLLGLKPAVPNNDLVEALRAERLLTIAAGDNVVRLLPPLIVSESEIVEAVARIDRACAGLKAVKPRGVPTGAVV